MREIIITPHQSELNISNHINNTVVPVWCEKGREHLLDFIREEMRPGEWLTIVARMEVDYKAQLYLTPDVIVKSGIESIGNRSFVVHQEVWQKDILAAVVKLVLVSFDYQNQQACPIPDKIRERLEAEKLDT